MTGKKWPNDSSCEYCFQSVWHQANNRLQELLPLAQLWGERNFLKQHAHYAPCKVIQIPEFSRFLFLESEILCFGIRNSQRGIQNPRLYWFSLHGVNALLFSSLDPCCTHLSPSFDKLWIVVPWYLQADTITLHLVKVRSSICCSEEKFSPQKLPMQRNWWVRVLFSL